MKTTTMKPIGKPTEAERQHAMDLIEQHKQQVRWVYRLEFGYRSTAPRVTGLGYYHGQLCDVSINANARETDATIEAIPVNLADAMACYIDLQTTERVAWADNEHGEALEDFLRAVKNALAAAERPQAIAA